MGSHKRREKEPSPETASHSDSPPRSRRRQRLPESSDDGSDRERMGSRSMSKNITDKEIYQYLAKKAQKKALKVAKKLKAQDVSSFYSRDFSNPFVWSKKIEADITTQGVPMDMFSVKAEKKKQRERMAEIEKVKKRREERAIEKAKQEEVMALLARERARAEFQDWEKKEQEFDFYQSKLRSEIWLREGRAKPIDFLSGPINNSSDDSYDIDIYEPPYTVFKGLTVKEMEELVEEIKMHLDLDRRATPTHIEYWEALLILGDWELAEARRKKDAIDRDRGLHSSIEEDVKKLLDEKSYSDLEVLQSQIESQMRSGTAKVVEYWEAVLMRLRIYKAKACLKEIHTKLMLDKKPLKVEDNHVLEYQRLIIENKEDNYDDKDDDGSYSPQLLQGDDDEDAIAIDPEQDRVILDINRRAVLEKQRKWIQEAYMTAIRPAPSEENLELKAMKAMGTMEEGDAVFGSNNEICFDSQVMYWWRDKYRPRKPKYFNRVHVLRVE